MTFFLLPHSSSFLSQLLDQSSFFPFISILSFILILSHPFFLQNNCPVSHTSTITSFFPPNSSSFLSHILYDLLSSTHHLLSFTFLSTHSFFRHIHLPFFISLSLPYLLLLSGTSCTVMTQLFTHEIECSHTHQEGYGDFSE
jgi:hypothetical protein